MGIARAAQPVKYFAALLAADENLFLEVERDLSLLLGEIETASPILPWTLTDYYKREMGAATMRKFVGFRPIAAPDRLAAVKLAAQELETRYARERGGRRDRRINIDPGYLEVGKVVLATTKNAAHRVYVGAGIYAESTLYFHNRQAADRVFEPTQELIARRRRTR
jgi:hypothetical protein